MLKITEYLQTGVKKILPEIHDFLSGIHIEKYLTLANVLKTIGTLSASYVAYKVARILAVRRKYAHIPGPETKGLLGFFIGNMPSAEKMKREGKAFPDYVYDCHLKFGPVFKFRLVDQVVIFTIDPIAIKECLVTKNFPKSMILFQYVMFPLNSRFSGYGLITDPNNEHWRKQRNVFNPGFHRNALMNYVAEFNSKADVLTEKLRLLADGKTPVNISAKLNHTTLDVIASIAFGMSLDSINNEADRVFGDYLHQVLITAGEMFRNPWIKYDPRFLPRALRLRRMIKFIRKTGEKKVIERMGDNLGSTEQNDIMANILKSSRGSTIDIELMLDHFVTFFTAGQETTSNALAFCFLELGRNKNVLDKCQEEVDSVLGTRTEITYEDISKLKYVGSVFKETLRIYPTAPCFYRFTNEEITINGLKIPASSHLGFPVYSAGRMESNFSNPLEFKPERFIKDANSIDTAVPGYAYFPFSIGPRSCIGQNFAQIEGIVILAKFIQKFDFYLAPNRSFNTVVNVTLKVKDGVWIIISNRDR